jgi:hypothetical protein
MLNTPGFTAELALSGPARAYRSSAGPYVGTGLVQPALLTNLPTLYPTLGRVTNILVPEVRTYPVRPPL